MRFDKVFTTGFISLFVLLVIGYFEKSNFVWIIALLAVIIFLILKAGIGEITKGTERIIISVIILLTILTITHLI